MPQKRLHQDGKGNGPGEARSRSGPAEPSKAEDGNGHSGMGQGMEAVVERGNLLLALKRVKQNQGSPGVDGMTVQELTPYLREVWPGLREQLLAGSYQPKPVKQVSIPKSNGGSRELGIPTVLDRFIQQALLQILQPTIDPTFSPHSYGFRPGKSAHQALKAARTLVSEGRRFVVDMDLEKFFDRMNHDILMERVSRRIADKRILGLIRRYLDAGILHQGVVMGRHEGTPQGGPLSPLLANVLLDEVDKALEKRGHRFVRYADDCNVYVGSKRAGERVMAFLRTRYGRLKLKVNEAKSAVDLVTRRKILGHTMEFGPNGVARLKVAPKALLALKDKVRVLTRRNGGKSIGQVVADLRGYLPGWKAYFSLAKEPKLFLGLDEWIRHRLRQLHLKQWKRGTTAFRELLARGVSPRQARNVAANAQSWWKTAGHALNAALPIQYFDRLGVPRLA